MATSSGPALHTSLQVFVGGTGTHAPKLWFPAAGLLNYKALSNIFCLAQDKAIGPSEAWLAKKEDPVPVLPSD